MVVKDEIRLLNSNAKWPKFYRYVTKTIPHQHHQQQQQNKKKINKEVQKSQNSKIVDNVHSWCLILINFRTKIALSILLSVFKLNCLPSQNGPSYFPSLPWLKQGNFLMSAIIKSANLVIIFEVFHMKDFSVCQEK